MKLNIFTVVSFCVLFMMACKTKEERLVGDLQQFVTELQNKADRYSEDDWQKAFQEYATIVGNLQEGRFTDGERREIGRLKGQCWAIFTPYTFDALGKELKGTAEEFSGTMEGFMKSLDASTEEYIEAFTEAMEEFMGVFNTSSEEAK